MPSASISKGGEMMRDRGKGWKQTEREGDREVEQTSMSGTSIAGCGEMMRDSQSEGWLEKGTEDRQRKVER